MATVITFNSFSLQSANFLTRGIDRYGIPNRRVERFPLSFRDNSKVVTSFWDTKIIELVGTVVGSSETDLQSNISQAKANLAIPEAVLAIPYAGVTLNYQATCVSAEFPRENFNVMHCPYTMVFEITDPPFGIDTVVNNHSNDAMTAASVSSTLSIGGEVPSRPVITLEVNSETDLTIIEFTQDDTGDAITVEPSGGYSAGDIVIINTNTNTVTYNGNEIDYSGLFPEFIVGTNNYTLDFTSTAHNVDLDIDWQDYYL